MDCPPGPPHFRPALRRRFPFCHALFLGFVRAAFRTVWTGDLRQRTRFVGIKARIDFLCISPHLFKASVGPACSSARNPSREHPHGYRRMDGYRDLFPVPLFAPYRSAARSFRQVCIQRCPAPPAAPPPAFHLRAIPFFAGPSLGIMAVQCVCTVAFTISLDPAASGSG